MIKNLYKYYLHWALYPSFITLDNAMQTLIKTPYKHFKPALLFKLRIYILYVFCVMCFVIVMMLIDWKPIMTLPIIRKRTHEDWQLLFCWYH